MSTDDSPTSPRPGNHRARRTLGRATSALRRAVEVVTPTPAATLWLVELYDKHSPLYRRSYEVAARDRPAAIDRAREQHAAAGLSEHSSLMSIRQYQPTGWVDLIRDLWGEGVRREATYRARAALGAIAGDTPQRQRYVRDLEERIEDLETRRQLAVSMLRPDSIAETAKEAIGSIGSALRSEIDRARMEGPTGRPEIDVVAWGRTVGQLERVLDLHRDGGASPDDDEDWES